MINPSVVTGDKNNSTVAHAGRKRRPKWVPGAWGIAGPPCPEVYKYGWTGTAGWGVGQQADNLSP